MLMRDLGGVEPGRGGWVYGPEVMNESEAAFTLDNLAQVLGNPDECVQQLHRWSEALGTDYVMAPASCALGRTATSRNYESD